MYDTNLQSKVYRDGEEEGDLSRIVKYVEEPMTPARVISCHLKVVRLCAGQALPTKVDE
jgi:hypothetical protein